MRHVLSLRVMGVLLSAAAPAARAQGAAKPAAKPAAGPAAQEPLADSALTAATMQRLQLVAYPSRGQTPRQTDRDERACTAWAQTRTGVDAAALADHDAKAAGAAARRDARGQGGGAASGAVKGAVVGTAVGAISGNAGRGAGYGAVGGAVQGSRAKQRAGARAEQQASAAADTAWVRRADHLKRGITTCLGARGYAVR